MIYLDSAATSLLKPKSVSRAVARAIDTMASPGRGAHRAAMLAADTVFDCRSAVAELFDVPEPEQVVFTLNATHALNIAIRSLASRGSRVTVSGYEHNSVMRVLYDLGCDVSVAESPLFDEDAAVTAFRRLIPQSDLVICNHVSNVFGFILPIKRISEICAEYGVPLIIDASQSAGITKISFTELGAQYIAMPGHKGLLGPQGTGVLLCGDVGRPLLCGGTGSDSINEKMPDYLPDRLEAGTHNVAGIAGLREGIRYIKSMGEERICGYETMLCGIMADRLSEVEGLTVYRSNRSQAGVLSVRHERIDPEALCGMLGEHGIAARCGLHCAPLAHRTVGTLDTGTLRLSFSPFLSKAKVIDAANTIARLINSKIHQ